MSGTHSNAAVLVEQRDGYQVLTLNRPERLNAFNDDMHLALREALAAASTHQGCRAVMITGAGRGFCAGQDLSARRAEPGEVREWKDALGTFYNPLVRQIRGLPFPVVAAVNGVAAGAGANVALACDIVIAARSAKFVQSFTRIGLVPDSGGTWFLPRLVGSARARGLALLAEPLGAEQAEQWGLIWKVVDDADLAGEGSRVCERLAAAPTLGLSLAKRALQNSETSDLDTQLELERELQREAGGSPDYAEAVRAFLEKRPPRVPGR